MNKISEINLKIKENIIYIISMIILLQPVIDLTIGFSIRTNFFPSAMSFIRIILLLFLLYYFIFINNARNKRKITVFLCLISVYLVCYFINQDFSFVELKEAAKVFYFPSIFLVFFAIFDDEKRFVDKQYLLISLAIYSIVIIIGFITKTAFDSYSGVKLGTSGYFYAANEISGIISILLPFVFEYVFSKINIKKIIYFIVVISSIIIIGTKTPFISLVICTFYYIFRLINKRNILKISLIFVPSIILLSTLMLATPLYKNIVIHANFLKVKNITEFITKPELIDHFFLGSRLKFLDNNTQIYLKSDISDQLIGVGYINDPKLVEMDFFDIFFRQGIIGCLIFFIIIFNIMLFNKRKYNKKYILPLALIVLISTIVGHVLTAPAVSTFVAIILCGFTLEDKV